MEARAKSFKQCAIMGDQKIIYKICFFTFNFDAKVYRENSIEANGIHLN